MVSLWGSNKNGEQREDGDEDQHHAASLHDDTHVRRAEVDERTRLLPPQRADGGYLSPDDPAVSDNVFDPSRYPRLTSPGFALQPLPCPRSEILRSPLPHDRLPVVGPPLRLHFRQPSWHEHSRLGFLRLRLHHPHGWKYSCRTSFFRCPVGSHGRP